VVNGTVWQSLITFLYFVGAEAVRRRTNDFWRSAEVLNW
jgi:hypothetical protein